MLSCRKIRHGEEHARAVWDNHETYISTVWHRNTLLSPFAGEPGRTFSILTTHHADGDMAARYSAAFGGHAIRGAGTGKASQKPSKNKGGAKALRGMMRELKNGMPIWLTADIPPGPKCECGEGIIILSRLSGKPILPMVVRTSREKILHRTWDDFLVPLPFGKAAIIWGEPILVPPDADTEMIESYRCKLEDSLNALHARACAELGTA